MNIIVNKGRYFTPEALEQIEAMAAEHSEQFYKWMLPFYKPLVSAALIKGWKGTLTPGESAIWVYGRAGLRALLGGDVFEGQRWLHISLSRENKRLPTWADMVAVKETFLGEETTVLQIFAPRSQWVNDTSNVLHLYHNLDAPGLIPDLRITIPGGHKTI